MEGYKVNWASDRTWVWRKGVSLFSALFLLETRDETNCFGFPSAIMPGNLAEGTVGSKNQTDLCMDCEESNFISVHLKFLLDYNSFSSWIQLIICFCFKASVISDLSTFSAFRLYGCWFIYWFCRLGQRCSESQSALWKCPVVLHPHSLMALLSSWSDNQLQSQHLDWFLKMNFCTYLQMVDSW